MMTKKLQGPEQEEQPAEQNQAEAMVAGAANGGARTAPPDHPAGALGRRGPARAVEDAFTVSIGTPAARCEVTFDSHLDHLWEANPELQELLREAPDLESAREGLYGYLEHAERELQQHESELPGMEQAALRACLRAFKDIIGRVNERRTGFSALERLWLLARGEERALTAELSAAFLMEFIHLFQGVTGRSDLCHDRRSTARGSSGYPSLEGQEGAGARNLMLDEQGVRVRKYFKKYPSGLDPEVQGWRRENRRRILDYFGAGEPDWRNHEWQIRNIIREPGPLLDLIELDLERQEAVRRAVERRVPFGITPYYLSLIDRDPAVGFDRAVRARVLPPREYVELLIERREDRALVLELSGEHGDAPSDLISHRYPGVALMKPFGACAQCCVFCQSPFEQEERLDPQAAVSGEALEETLRWLDRHRSVGDILITGGDPAILNDETLGRVLEALASREQLFRIRLVTRSPVVLPMRWTDQLVRTIARFHEPGCRELAVVTCFQHPYEITPEALEAVQKIRRAGIAVYNQQLFTADNSRRFESAKLRRDLRLIGVDPYHALAVSGREEHRRFLTPIARLLQERQEEADLLPGLDRTDQPVLNLGGLGQSEFRCGQNHRLLMILPDGARVYELHPWEKNNQPAPPFHYTDIPIQLYLEELAARGEDIRDYRSIWYYY